VGASGSGKSTLLHILGGVDRPTSGKVFLDEQDIYALNNKDLAVFRRRQVGLIYQFYNLIPVLDAEENITLPVVMDGQKPEPAKVEEMLHLMGLTERRRHLPSQLSGGQQQRVSIGRALFTAPGVILADEPTGNLDEANEEIVVDLFHKLHDEGTTLIVVTHDPEVAEVAQRTLVLRSGKLHKEIVNENFTGKIHFEDRQEVEVNA
jgi:putative ABC transport system ATP-binding protein